MKIFILFVLVFLISTIHVIACQCGYGGSFLKVSKNSSFITLTALVKVIKYLTFEEISGQLTPMSMEVEVIDIYKGKEERKHITVWGNPGNLCRPYLFPFKKDSCYAIAFHAAGWDSTEKKTDYSVSICGAYWLNVDAKNSRVTGDIDSDNKTNRTISLSELESLLNK